MASTRRRECWRGISFTLEDSGTVNSISVETTLRILDIRFPSSEILPYTPTRKEHHPVLPYPSAYQSVLILSHEQERSAVSKKRSWGNMLIYDCWSYQSLGDIKSRQVSRILLGVTPHSYRFRARFDCRIEITINGLLVREKSYFHGREIDCDRRSFSRYFRTSRLNFKWSGDKHSRLDSDQRAMTRIYRQI